MFRKNWWVIFVILPIGSAIGLVMAAAYTYVHPKIYESEGIIEVRLPSNISSGTEHQYSRALATEMAKMKSHGTLGQVITNLDLTNRWNVDAISALTILNNKIFITQIPNTSLISIRSHFTNKVDARDIVDSVITSYHDLRKSAVEEQASTQLNEINKLLRDQEDRVEEYRKILTIIVRNKGPNLTKSESQEDTINRALDAQDYLDAKRDFENEMNLLQSIKIKQMEETLAAKVTCQIVTVHSPPLIAASPILPNVTSNLMRGIGLGLLASLPIALLIMWLMPRPGVAL